MSEEAIESWGKIYPAIHIDLKVWMGETIGYCEKVEEMLN